MGDRGLAPWLTAAALKLQYNKAKTGLDVPEKTGLLLLLL